MDWFTIEDVAISALGELGLIPPDSFNRGVFQAVDAVEGRSRNKAGRVKIYADGLGGFAQNWRTDQKRSFFLNKDSKGAAAPISEIERLRIEQERQKRQAEQAEAARKATRRAGAIWAAAGAAPADHPYLSRKRVKPHGVRLTTWKRVIKNDAGELKTLSISNALLLPLFDANGALRSLQAIFPGLARI